MSKANSIHTTTRRALALGGGAPAAVGVTAGAAAMTADQLPALAGGTVSPDAELLALGRRLAAEEATINAWDAAAQNVTDEEIETAMEPCRTIVHQIEHMEAHTLQGLRVKAHAISWCNCGEEIDPDRFCPYPGATTDGRIAASIVRDLLRRV